MKAGRVIVSSVTSGTIPDFGTVPAIPDFGTVPAIPDFGTVPATPDVGTARVTAPGPWTVAIGSDGRAAVGEEALVVVPGPGALLRIVHVGRQVSTHAIEHGGRMWVHVAGDVYLFDVTIGSAQAARPRNALSDGSSAPMPATVRAVLVKPGDPVAPGDTLLMLEAMKMELPIRAAREGRVKAVHCKAGELVQPGVPLVEIE